MSKLFIILSLTVFICACCRESSYDECILKHMEGVNSDQAAKLIHNSCRSKFKGTNLPDSSILTNEQTSKISGKAGPGFQANYFTGDIYNGNQEVTITSIELAIYSKGGDFDEIKNYNATAYIPPLSTGTIGFSFIPVSGKIKWHIIRAKGFVVE